MISATRLLCAVALAALLPLGAVAQTDLGGAAAVQRIRVGSGDPDDTLGIDGDYWLNGSSGNVRVRIGGTYYGPACYVSCLMGPAGQAGAPGLKGDTGVAGATGPAGQNATTTTSATAATAGLMSATDKAKMDTYPAYAVTVYNNAVARTLGTGFTISATRAADVTYTVRIAYSVTALLGSTGAVDLQYSTDTGSTWVTVNTVSNSVNLGLALSGYNDFTLHGRIPAGALVRLNSTATNAANTYRTGQETLQ